MVIGVLPGHKGRIGHPDHTHFIGQTPLDEARQKIGDYIDRYHHRPHSQLAYRTPREVAATWKDHDDQSIPAA